jgi:hypothetical protein
VGLAATALDVRRTGSYERHRPETTTLYAVVRDNVETLYAAVAAGFEGAALLRIPLHSISRSGRIRSGFRASDQGSERSDEYGAGQAAGWVSGWGFRPFWRRMDEPRRVST